MTPLRCRLLVEGPADGPRQMAIDEALLETAAERGLATLRFYQWSQPTLSLGYFQSISHREQHAASLTCPVVRRQTGGGAILHDREVTYSLAIPSAHAAASNSLLLYEAVHDALIDTLGLHGIAARRRPAVKGNAAPEPFLCFQRCSMGDVLLGDVKVCGSAQRRRRGAVLQHGSLLLARSRYAPQLPGIYDLCQPRPQRDEIIANWSRAIGQALGLALEDEPLHAAELAAAEQFRQRKYAHVAWTTRR